MNGTLIASTPRGSMQPLAYQGILATDCHHQIVSILRSRLGDTHVLLFAEPAYDPGREIVDWYTPVQGTPIRLIDLPEERQNQVRGTLIKMASEILTQAIQLKNTGDNARILSGSIIELALQYPGDTCLYLVGEQPVIICWGFGPATAGATPQDLTRLAPSAIAAAAAVPRPTEPGPSPSVVTAPEAPASEAPPLPSPVVVKRRSWPWWLTVFLCLLLLLLLLFGVWSFLGRPALGWLPFGMMDRGAVLSSPSSPSSGGDDAALEAALARRDALQKERDGLKAALAEKAGQCKEPEKQSTPAASGRANELQVPDNAGQGGNVSFLQGVWRCDADLSTPQDPVSVDYIFDGDGKGQITVKTASKICSAGVKASMRADGNLLIESDKTIPCSTGKAIEGQSVECVGKGAQTACTGTNLISQGVWKAKFYKF